MNEKNLGVITTRIFGMLVPSAIMEDDFLWTRLWNDRLKSSALSIEVYTISQEIVKQRKVFNSICFYCTIRLKIDLYEKAINLP